MNKRIQQFLSAENITQSQFADTIGVARATISHIISGRNKPGLDVVESICSHYPDLNLEWLVTGHGKMYKTSSDLKKETEFFNEDLFGQNNSKETLDEQSKNINNENPEYIKKAAIIYNGTDSGNIPPVSGEIAAADYALKRNDERIRKKTESAQSEPSPVTKSPVPENKTRKISKIIVLFDDGSFQELGHSLEGA